jgi:hypothetical protein
VSITTFFLQGGEKMNARKLIVILAVFGMAFVSINTYAASDWYVCTVDRVGPGGNQDLVLLQLTDTDGAFSTKWFKACSGREKEYLAIGLTAIANSLTVKIQTDISGRGYPDITSLYLNN